MANNTVLSQVDWTLLMIIVWFKEFILQIHINSYGYGYGWRWSEKNSFCFWTVSNNCI